MSLYSKIRAKLYREATYLRRDIGHLLGLNNAFYRNARGSRMLIYHGICKYDHTRFNPIFLTERTLERHLRLYKKYCNVLTLDDFYAGRLSNDKFNICLTFDDGMANNYKYVLPLLEKYQLPATFFITGVADAGYDILWNHFLNIASAYGPETLIFKGQLYKKNKYHKYLSKAGSALREELRDGGFEEKAEMMKILQEQISFKNDHRNKDYWLQLTKDEIKALSQSPYATIGAHGYYHNDLTKISEADAFDELIKTKDYLQNLIGKPVNSVAFPYGSYTPAVVKQAKSAGYNQLLTMDFYDEADKNDDTMHERFTVSPYISPVNQLYATINRRYE